MDLEICSIQDSTDEDIKAGRVKLTMSAYEIHETGNYTQHNKRGLHWEEKYTINNMQSAVGAPFVVRFIDDDRSYISDHGRMENDIEDGTVIFPDSDTVGHIEKVWIAEKEIEKKIRKVLMVSGVIYDQRYHELVKYLRAVLSSGGKVKGSVEICGKGGSPQIIYEHGIGSHDADGRIVIPRTPVQYDITALAILSDYVPPADDGSEIIEINSLKGQENKPKNLNKNQDKKEDDQMAETNSDSIMELNNKIIAQAAELNELHRKITEKETELNKCKDELNSYKEKETELSKCKDDLKTSKEKETELNALLVEANKTVESQKTQIAELNSEIEPLRKLKMDIDAKTAQSEINAYFETIKKENGFSEAELNSLKTEYVDKCDLKGLKAKETELCVNKFKEMKRAGTAYAELNSNGTEVNGLFFSTKHDHSGANDGTTDGSDLFR